MTYPVLSIQLVGLCVEEAKKSSGSSPVQQGPPSIAQAAAAKVAEEAVKAREEFASVLKDPALAPDTGAGST